MSTGDVQKFIEEMCLLVDGKLKLAFGGYSRSYLDNLRRDLLGENRLLCAIAIGMADEIKQINHDDSNVGEVAITTTFLGLKVPWYVDGLAGLHLDCAGLPEGKDAEAGASYILEEFDKMREELRKFKNEYLPSLGEHDLASQPPNVDEVTFTKAALGCVMCADNASAAQAKSRCLMRKIYRLLNPGLEWFLIQPLGWLQSLKVDDGSSRRVLTMDRVLEHYELIIAAMRDVMENPDIARRKDYRIFGIQEYPQLGQLLSVIS